MKEEREKRTNSFDINYRWIGVDLDETLAEYHGENYGLLAIGKPIPKMIERVKKWLGKGEHVKIFTGRASPLTCDLAGVKVEDVVNAIQEWTLKHIGEKLEVTNEKDHGTVEMWDDRCVQVIRNTGEIKGEM